MQCLVWTPPGQNSGCLYKPSVALCSALGLGLQHSAYHTCAPEINVSSHTQMALSLGSGAQREYSEAGNRKHPLY